MSKKETFNEIPSQQADTPTDVMVWIEQLERNDPAFAHMVAEEKKRLNLGEQIRNLRENHNLTQSELARRAATSQSMVARIESGNQDNLRMETLLRLAAALGLELDIRFRRPKRGSQQPLGIR